MGGSTVNYGASGKLVILVFNELVIELHAL